MTRRAQKFVHGINLSMALHCHTADYIKFHCIGPIISMDGSLIVMTMRFDNINNPQRLQMFCDTIKRICGKNVTANLTEIDSVVQSAP